VTIERPACAVTTGGDVRPGTVVEVVDVEVVVDDVEVVDVVLDDDVVVDVVVDEVVVDVVLVDCAVVDVVDDEPGTVDDVEEPAAETTAPDATTRAHAATTAIGTRRATPVSLPCLIKWRGYLCGPDCIRPCRQAGTAADRMRPCAGAARPTPMYATSAGTWAMRQRFRESTIARERAADMRRWRSRWRYSSHSVISTTASVPSAIA